MTVYNSLTSTVRKVETKKYDANGGLINQIEKQYPESFLYVKQKRETIPWVDKWLFRR